MFAIIAALLIAAGMPQPPIPRPGSSEGSFAITNVTVIDGTGAPARSDMTVLVSGDRIVSIGRTHESELTKGVAVVDGAGKFLIPGLWDMHVHGATHEDYLDLFIANGITGVRDMFGSLKEIKRRREEIEGGARIGPHIVAAGRVLDGPYPILPAATAINTASEARDAVRAAKQEGSDFVKVYSVLPREAYFAVADEAKKLDIPFAGHVPETVTPAEASDARQKSIEHLTGLLLACSSKESRLREEMSQHLGSAGGLAAAYRSFLYCQAESLETYSEEKAQSLFARFVKNHTWHCPTLTVLRGFAYMDDASFTDDPRVIFLSPWIRMTWDPKTSFVYQYLNRVDFTNLKRGFKKDIDLVGRMHRAGVGILAGTDTSGPYCFPGFSLHEELALLVDAGLTPMQALQAATVNPARFLGRAQTLGTIEKGKIADMVLLEANPLEDIKNTRKISAVVVRGHALFKNELQELIRRAADAASKK